MSKRLIWSIILVVLGIAIAFIERGPIGGLLGPFFIVVALLLWVVPEGTLAGNPLRSTIWENPIVLTIVGVGIGLLAATAGAYFLPAKIFSWLLILVGITLAGWLLLRRRR
jgi:hypothetical protein